MSRLRGLLRRLRPLRVRDRPLQLRSTAGYRIVAALHSAEGTHRQILPTILLCPDVTRPLPISPPDLIALGCRVMTFSPAGRGQSWGPDDRSGPEQQDNVRVALRYLAARDDVDAKRLGIITIGEGLAMATGALADLPSPSPQWLIDIDGVADRIPLIDADHPLDDNHYWQPREAIHHLPALRCGYLRLQTHSKDPVPGLRLLQAASRGQVTWFQINQHPRGTIPTAVPGLPRRTRALKRAILDAVQRLSEEEIER
ncbi:MAG: hypothetical protein AAFV53_17280 [Myxococcota bacterium]